jgi:DNA-binding MarR family transcriptional regulator
VRVFLTPRAKAIRKELIEILGRHSEILGRDFSRQQKAELLKTLKKVYNNVLDYKNERQKKIDDISEN